MSKTKFTFGNILLSLLLLGTVVVIGLIVLVYFQLTSTGQRSSRQQPVAESTPNRPIEIMSPDGKPAFRPQNADGSQPPQAASDTVQQEADAAANALKADNSPVNTRALTSGAYVPRKPRPPRQPRVKREKEYGNRGYAANNGDSQSSKSGSLKGEVPLEPVNRAPREKPLVPKNSERANRERGNNNNNSGERQLTPVKPIRQNKQQSESIDALF
ncbi:MAG: hypothetical protein Q4E77_00085 [Conchiformibius sp.]|nr:hypothetical protein [Conchiformibius sp.]